MKKKTRREFLKESSIGSGLIAGAPLLRPAAEFLRPQPTTPAQEGLLAWWRAEPAEGDELVDWAGQLTDPIAGNYRYGQGSAGGLKLDGFSTRVTREADRAPNLAKIGRAHV